MRRRSPGFINAILVFALCSSPTAPLCVAEPPASPASECSRVALGCYHQAIRAWERLEISAARAFLEAAERTDPGREDVRQLRKKLDDLFPTGRTHLLNQEFFDLCERAATRVSLGRFIEAADDYDRIWEHLGGNPGSGWAARREVAAHQSARLRRLAMDSGMAKSIEWTRAGIGCAALVPERDRTSIRSIRGSRGPVTTVKDSDECFIAEKLYDSALMNLRSGDFESAESDLAQARVLNPLSTRIRGLHQEVHRVLAAPARDQRCDPFAARVPLHILVERLRGEVSHHLLQAERFTRVADFAAAGRELRVVVKKLKWYPCDAGLGEVLSLAESRALECESRALFEKR